MHHTPNAPTAEATANTTHDAAVGSTIDGSPHSPRRSRSLHRIGDTAANPLAGVLAACLGGIWLIIGAARGFPDWWQVALYSATALTTFVMVFVIQHTQSRQVAALQRKLDELIRSSRQADNSLIAVEHAPDEELQQLAVASKDRRIEALGG
jgi:low affinity Fe/Cu permease